MINRELNIDWIKSGQKVDLYDNGNKCWRIATVTQISNTLIKCKYDGLSHYKNFTESMGQFINIKEISNKLRPLNTHTPIHRYLSKNNTNNEISECSPLVYEKNHFQIDHVTKTKVTKR